MEKKTKIQKKIDTKIIYKYLGTHERIMAKQYLEQFAMPCNLSMKLSNKLLFSFKIEANKGCA